jgi:hypothetical protein
MSWQIPTQIEQDIIAGKATYRTFQTGNGGQSILPVPANAYVVIFGYDFSPAGGGLSFIGQDISVAENNTISTPLRMKRFETQQVSFYTGTDFYPFIHHVDTECNTFPRQIDASIVDNNVVVTVATNWTIKNTPIARQVYITSSNDVTITHGLILSSTRISANAIPVTNRTPQGLTYGGSGQTPYTQTNYGPGVNPLQFVQPSPKDYQDFAFGLLPANADGQAFATPDVSNGLLDSSDFINAIGFPNDAAGFYYLNCHYALYSKIIPSKQA